MFGAGISLGIQESLLVLLESLSFFLKLPHQWDGNYTSGMAFFFSIKPIFRVQSICRSKPAGDFGDPEPAVDPATGALCTPGTPVAPRSLCIYIYVYHVFSWAALLFVRRPQVRTMETMGHRTDSSSM